MRSVLWVVLLVPVVAVATLFTVRQQRSQMPYAVVCQDDNVALIQPAESTSWQKGVKVAKRSVAPRSKPIETTREVWNTCVTGGPRSTQEEALKDARDKARLAVQARFDLDYMPTTERIINMETFEPDKDLQTMEINNEPMLRATVHLEVQPENLDQLSSDDRRHRSNDRMLISARVLAVIVVGLGAISAYVRLDEWSKGYATGALKFLAIAAVIGAGIGVWTI